MKKSVSFCYSKLPSTGFMANWTKLQIWMIQSGSEACVSSHLTLAGLTFFPFIWSMELTISTKSRNFSSSFNHPWITDSGKWLLRDTLACDSRHLMLAITANLTVTEYDFHFGILSIRDLWIRDQASHIISIFMLFWFRPYGGCTVFMHSCATQLGRKQITLTINCCFMKPPPI